jgi:hypothetical protein
MQVIITDSEGNYKSQEMIKSFEDKNKIVFENTVNISPGDLIFLETEIVVNKIHAR